jgi:hypothetical protein
MRSVGNLAAIYRGLLAELGIVQAALIGLGFAVGIAAEMAATLPDLVLVAPMGMTPPEDDILDQAIISYIDHARAGFHQRRGTATIAARPSPLTCRLGVGIGHQPAKKWDQFAAVTLSVLQRLIAADQ